MTAPPDQQSDVPPPSGNPPGILSLRTIAMPADTNPAGQIFGGWLLSQMDLAAGTRASLRAGSRCVTVAIDAMVFHAPVFVGDEVTCYTEIAKVGRTSLSLHVEAWVRRGRHNEPPVKVTSGLFHFVAVDDAGRPSPLSKTGDGPMTKKADGQKETDG